MVDEALRPNSPADLPASRIEELASGEDRDCPVPVVTDRGKALVSAAIESREIIHLVRKDQHVWAIVEDVRDLLHLLLSENFASRVVRRVEDKHLRSRLGEGLSELGWVKLPDTVLEGERNAKDASTI